MPENEIVEGAAVVEGAAAPTTAATAVTPPASTDTARTSAATTGYTYQEDRSKWIPPHRLNEETTKRQTLEQQIAERDRKIAAYRAEAGIAGPADAESEKKEAVRKAFFAMFPDLTEEKMRERDASVSHAKAAEQREWARHGKQQMSTIYTQVAEALGAESLSDDQKSDLQDGFKSWLSITCQKELQASGGAESATLTAYEDGDPKVLAAFVKRHTESWVEPARRKVTAQTLGRTRPVPDSTGRSQVTSIKRPEKFADLDARIAYASELAAERGFAFDDRR